MLVHQTIRLYEPVNPPARGVPRSPHKRHERQLTLCQADAITAADHKGGTPHLEALHANTRSSLPQINIERRPEAVMEEAGDDPALIAAALGTVARAHGMQQLAKDTGLTREGLYKALSPEGNPNLGTVMKVMRALGLRLAPARVVA
jgi:probable addiction module antidote protein